MANKVNKNEAKTMSQQIAEYITLKAKEKELKAQLKDIEDSIKGSMEVLKVTEVRENGFVARVEHGTQRKFDTKKFQKDHLDMYEAYRHDVATTSFKAFVEA